MLRFSAELIQHTNTPSIPADRELNQLDDSKMMGVARGAKAGCGQGGGRCLKSRVIGDVQSPVVTEPGALGGARVGQIAVDHCQEVGDLCAA